MGASNSSEPKPKYSYLGLIFGQLCQKSKFIAPADKKTIQQIESLNLKGKRYLITGASSGIGQYMCRLLIQQGASLIMVSRSIPRLQKALDTCIEEITQVKPDFDKTQIDVKLMTLDLANIDNARSFCDELLRDNVELDGLVNNGGALPLHQKLQKYNGGKDEIEETLATHVISPYILSKRLMPLVEKRKGIIMNNSSAGAYGQKLNLQLMVKNFAPCIVQNDAEKKYEDGALVYAQCKRSMLEYTDYLAKENTHIDIISTHPGWAKTPGTDALFEEKPQYKSIKFRESLDAAYGMCVPIYMHQNGQALKGGAFYFDGKVVKTHQTLAGTEVPFEKTDQLVQWLNKFV